MFFLFVELCFLFKYALFTVGLKANVDLKSKNGGILIFYDISGHRMKLVFFYQSTFDLIFYRDI